MNGRRMLAAGAAAAGLVLAGAAGAAFAAERRARRWFSFRGKVALVTGGSRGLGLVLARQLARAGARVAICARDEAELARARAQIAAAADGAGGPAGKVAALRCDVSRRDEVITLVRQVHEQLGPVDVLINNAGMIEVGPAEEMTVDDYERAMGVHFRGPLYAITEVVSDMRERGAGRIVNIASVGGKISVAHLLPYCASKFALVGLSSGLRAALAADGIAVTTVCPGLMRTGSPRNAAFKARHRAEYAWFSIGDALPVLSMDAECAARRILEACRRGDAELVMPATTAAAVKLSALLPAAAAAALTLVEEILPRPGGIGVGTKRGYESTSRWSPSWLTTLSDRAAARNNQFS